MACPGKVICTTSKFCHLHHVQTMSSVASSSCSICSMPRCCHISYVQDGSSVTCPAWYYLQHAQTMSSGSWNWLGLYENTVMLYLPWKAEKEWEMWSLFSENRRSDIDETCLIPVHICSWAVLETGFNNQVKVCWRWRNFNISLFWKSYKSQNTRAGKDINTHLRLLFNVPLGAIVLFRHHEGKV